MQIVEDLPASGAAREIDTTISAQVEAGRTRGSPMRMPFRQLVAAELAIHPVGEH
jgi:hypothetical protein